jgi:stringent starvation protein B
MADVSTKPYFIRAIYEWCSDCGFTPYLSVRVDDRTRVPVEYVKNGEIVLNVSLNATRNLTINNELIQFSARFNGVSREVSIPVDRVQGIFARENGQGAFFTGRGTRRRWRRHRHRFRRRAKPRLSHPSPPAAGRTRLKLVK